MTSTTYMEEVNSRLDFLESKDIGFYWKRVDRDVEALSQALLPKPPISSKGQVTPPPKFPGKQRKIPEYFSWRRQLPILPLEMIVEIASHMHPLDLLNYSRTCKSYRSILLSRGSRAAWNAALAAVPDLPHCPSDMSHPKYAALVFDRHCFACGTDGAYSVDYALRMRFCESCYSVNVSEGTEILSGVPRDVCDAVLLLVPTAERLSEHSWLVPSCLTPFSWATESVDFGRDLSQVITRINPVAHTEQDFFYVPELKAILSWFWPLPNAESFVRARTLLRQRVEYITQRQTHAAVLLAWNRVIEAMDGWPRWTPFDAARDAAELQDLISRGKHLAAQPPPISSDDYTDSDDDAHNIKLIVEARTMKLLQCSPPPKSTWQAFEEERLRGDKEAIAHHRRLQTRYRELEKWYQVLGLMYLDEQECDDAKLPNVYDGARLWEELIDPDARRSIDAKAFLDTLDEVDEKLEEYEDNLTESLAELVPESQDGDAEDLLLQYHSPMPDPLALPLAMFACNKCDDCVALPWPDINAHWQTAHSRQSIWLPHGAGLNVSWWKEGGRVAEQILIALPELRSMTLTELDDAIRTGKLYCACGDPSLEHPDKLSWAKLVHHFLSHARMDARMSSASNGSDDASLVWINDHVPSSCIKYNGNHADMEAASWRFSAEPAIVSRIHKWLNRCHDFSVLRCRICHTLAPHKDKADTWAYLDYKPDVIAHHMQAKHGKAFEELDVQFYHLLTADLQPGVTQS